MQLSGLQKQVSGDNGRLCVCRFVNGSFSTEACYMKGKKMVIRCNKMSGGFMNSDLKITFLIMPL